MSSVWVYSLVNVFDYSLALGAARVKWNGCWVGSRESWIFVQVMDSVDQASL